MHSPNPDATRGLRSPIASEIGYYIPTNLYYFAIVSDTSYTAIFLFQKFWLCLIAVSVSRIVLSHYSAVKVPFPPLIFRAETLTKVKARILRP